MSRITKVIKNPSKILLLAAKHNIKLFSDTFYTKIVYWDMFKKKINLNNPSTFNEKIQWLKLNDRKAIYTTLVDKYEVKQYVANKIGKEYVVPTLGLYDRFNEIDFDSLPNKFVIKCTHDSGGIYIVKDKSTFNKQDAKKLIDKYLSRNYYYAWREWPYKNVKPRILIEPYIEDRYYGELLDYKVYAFSGDCDYVMVCFDRFKSTPKFVYYDKQWNIMKSFSKDGLQYGDIIKLKKPDNLNKMFEFASVLSIDIPFVRVDFYEANGSLFFGEMTFYPSSGFDNTRTKEIEKYLDNKLDITELLHSK